VTSVSDVRDAVVEEPDVGQWVVQRYVERPLLLQGGRKFHVRAYVLCVGALEVHLFREALILVAPTRFRKNTHGAASAPSARESVTSAGPRDVKANGITVEVPLPAGAVAAGTTSPPTDLHLPTSSKDIIPPTLPGALHITHDQAA